MAKAPTRNELVLLPIVLMTFIVIPARQCLDLFKIATIERNATSHYPMENNVINITWYVNENGTDIDYDIRNNTELVKMSSGGSSNETLNDEAADLDKKVKGFFAGFFGGIRKKRSTGAPEKTYIGRDAKLWRSFLGEMPRYRRSGNVRFEKSYKDNIRWPAPNRWYNWPIVGSDDASREKSVFLPKKDGRYSLSNLETFPQPSKPFLRNKNRYISRPQHSTNPLMHSMRILKQSKNKLIMKKRKKGEKVETEGLVQRDVPEMMEIYAGNEHYPGPQSQYICKAGTNGLLSYQEGRKMRSRGLTYSEEDSRGIRTLLCKAETSDMFQPDPETFLKNSVTGLNVVTNDKDPFKFFDRGNDIDSEALEIGSQSGSELNYSSLKNQTLSSVSTQGRGAHAQTKASTRFINENGYRTAFESKADVEGSTTFNASENAIPLILTSRKEESSSVLQNSDKIGLESAENEGVSTFMNYKKKVDFDIAFRNFDY